MRERNSQTGQTGQTGPSGPLNEIGGTLYLTSGQAARRLGICKRTVLRAMRRGALAPAYQTPGGYFRFRAADVEAYAQRLRFETGARDDA